ncbi:MAG: TonB-dependent receptor [Bacteroidales bacterium]|nr:TonB-dependent receptor [Bacteroidales bacterium]
MRKFLLALLLTVVALAAVSQNATYFGYVRDANKKPVEFANVIVVGTNIGASTDASGYFEISVPSGQDLEVQISFLGYEPFTQKIKLKPNERKQVTAILNEGAVMLPTADIGATSERQVSGTRLNPQISMKIPTTGGFEDILKALPSVSSNNELSSQYNVRGGNYDENLVFVNDIEVYRPQLIRSGQQEGLSFINPDMVSSILFSAGAFEPKYGDKMSSVLDIKYKKPTEFGASIMASLLGANAHVEGTSKNHLFRYNVGLRYKTSKYLLTSMDVSGHYDPSYVDAQTFLMYTVTENLELNFLGNFSSNKYKYIPLDGETSFGTVSDALKIRTYFEGQEVDRFNSGTAAFSVNYTPSNNLSLKFIASGYYTNEEETYDILAQYYLNEIDQQLGSSIGDSVSNIGVGSFLDHARNYYDGFVISTKHIGTFLKGENKLDWGVQTNYENYSYHVHEWTMNDSADYSLPYSDNMVFLYQTDIANIGLQSVRASVYVQDSYLFKTEGANVSLGGGVRLNFWSFNKQFLASPRVNLSVKPTNWKPDMIFRFATGLYHQPPTIKEARRISDGTLNENIKAQSSAQVVVGMDYNFLAWGRPFKLVTEAYYKYMYNLNPYNVDNVQIKYYGDNIAHGYAYGIEAKVNGEFVPGTESWVSLGLMRTQEDIENDFYTQTVEGVVDTVYPGYIPRPTDQLVNFGIFFQDYIPKAPTWKVFLSLHFGTGLPYGPPNSERYMATGRMKAYRRVDFGISKQFNFKKADWLKDFWISLEVFNLLNTKNEISHTWITDIRGREYAVPSYLTGIRPNLKIVMKF